MKWGRDYEEKIIKMSLLEHWQIYCTILIFQLNLIIVHAMSYETTNPTHE